MGTRTTFSSASPPSLKKGELDELLAMNWRIDCPKMRLKSKRRKDSEVHSGGGEIRLDSQHRLRFRLYSYRQLNRPSTFIGPRPPAGSIVPDWFYYDLNATDLHGRKWKSDRLLPHFHRTAAGKTVITGELREMTSRGSYPESLVFSGDELAYHFFDEIAIPFNESTVRSESVAAGSRAFRSGTMNVWKFRSCGYQFLVIRESDDLLSLYCYSKGKRFPFYLDARVAEAFSFITGRPSHWRVKSLRRRNSVELVINGSRPIAPSSRFRPPLPLEPLESPISGKLTAELHRRLFHKFFRHLLLEGQKRHPVLGMLSSIYEAASAPFIDAEALTLTVAIEALLHVEFPNLGVPTAAGQNAIATLLQYVEDWNGSRSLRDRAKGAISNFRQSRALDKMRALAARGAITQAQYEAWQDLRNPVTHSYLTSGIPTPKFLKLVRTCEVLFYHLIFHAIGYKGPYTDFSEADWPMKQYPEV